MKAMNKVVAYSWKALLIAVAFPFLAMTVSAGIVSTESIVQSSDRDRVEAFLGREDVESKLKVLGVTPEFAKRRVDSLTDEEIRQIAGKLESAPAGAAITTNEWILIILIFILIVILL